MNKNADNEDLDDELSTTLRLLTFPLILLAGTLGFVGIVFGFLLLLIHLTRLESFGVPYFSPFAPLNIIDIKDTFIRLPIFMLKKRPKDAHAIKEQAIEESREWVTREANQESDEN